MVSYRPVITNIIGEVNGDWLLSTPGRVSVVSQIGSQQLQIEPTLLVDQTAVLSQSVYGASAHKSMTVVRASTTWCVSCRPRQRTNHED